MDAQQAEPANPRRVSALRDRGPRKGSKARVEALEASRGKKTQSVAGRITEEQLEKLTVIGELSPELTGNSARLARAIDIAFATVGDDIGDGEERGEAVATGDDAGDKGRDAGEAKERHAVLSHAAAQTILDALAERTRAYSELVKQVRAIGHQNNTLVKLAHQGVTYKKAAVVPEGAVLVLNTQVVRVLDELTKLAIDDSHVEQVVRQCRY